MEPSLQHADARATSKASATPQKNDRIQFLAGLGVAELGVKSFV